MRERGGREREREDERIVPLSLTDPFFTSTSVFVSPSLSLSLFLFLCILFLCFLSGYILRFLSFVFAFLMLIFFVDFNFVFVM